MKEFLYEDRGMTDIKMMIKETLLDWRVAIYRGLCIFNRFRIMNFMDRYSPSLAYKLGPFSWCGHDE